MSETPQARELIKLRDRLYALEDEITKISRALDGVINDVMSRATDEDDKHKGVPVVLSKEEFEALDYLLARRAVGSATDALILKNLVARIVT